MEQIDKLANFIMSEIEGEPSQDEGAGDTAIRIIKQLKTEIEKYEIALNKLARLGNEPELGNSDGNIIAQQALKVKTVLAFQGEEYELKKN